jgi:predicted PurR-regulated permease PerM
MTDPAAAATTTDLPDADDASQVTLHAPVSVRNVALVVLAGLAFVYTLYWARDVLVPLAMGLMLSYALEPLVARLERLHIVRAVGAALVLLMLVGSAVWLVVALSDDAAALVESLPQTAQKLRLAARGEPRQAKEGTIDKVQRAATEIEKAAAETAKAAPTTPRGTTRVIIEKSPFDIKNYLWSGTLGLLEWAGKALMVVLIAYFLLAAGDTFRRKMVKLSGDTLTQKKVTVQALDEIHGQIQRYLLVQLFTSAVVGIGTWLAFLAIGLDNSAVWGVVAGVTNLIPYLGGAFVGIGSAVLGFTQFNSIQVALLVGGASFAIHSIVGYVLTPWLTSKAGRMNPVAVFVGLLVWGWLWGLPGLLLGVPILMVVKAICDRVDDLKPIGELLGS